LLWSPERKALSIGVWTERDMLPTVQQVHGTVIRISSRW